MSWLKLDDAMGEHRKTRRLLRRGGLAPFGLHALALLHSAKYLLDGRVEREFVEEVCEIAKVRGKNRDAMVASLVESGQWEPTDDGWLLHDYLEHNLSRAQVLEQRRKDAARKAAGRRKESERCPDGQTPDSALPAGARGRGPGSGVGRKEEEVALTRTGVEDARAQIDDERVRETVDILRRCPRLWFDPELMGVANTLLAHPSADHRKAAHLAVASATDPSYRTTDAAKALHFAFAHLEREERRGGPPPFAGQRPTAESEAAKWKAREEQWRREDEAQERVA